MASKRMSSSWIGEYSSRVAISSMVSRSMSWTPSRVVGGHSLMAVDDRMSFRSASGMHLLMKRTQLGSVSKS